MRLPFWKVQAVGNDFVLVHAGAIGSRRPSDVAERLCARRTSIGADGLLVLAAEDAPTLRMFNPDGSEDFCGNGLRCAAVHAVLHHLVEGDEFAILHGGQSVPVVVEGDAPRVRRVRTRLQPASFEPARVPLATGIGEVVEKTWPVGDRQVVVSALSTGSTHAVISVEGRPEDRFFREVSRTLEHDPTFPERTSVIWSWPESGDAIGIRIWERGVGETLGCGTGSAAAATVRARLLGKGGRLVVRNPGGDVVVTMDDWRSPILVESDAEEVYSGWVELP
jgi:diaminopimelate epimerase